MKQILPTLKKLNQHLSFTKKAFTKGGFRHVQQYINGLITLNKKTCKKISEASLEEKHHSAINRVLVNAKFEQELLEKRYLKKINYLTKGHKTYLIFDDSLVERRGKYVEEAQTYKDHSSDSYLKCHQFFTSMIYTSFIQLPLFPKLYSKTTESKIEMALNLIDNINKNIKIYAILMDSWYSDKKIINKCKTKGIKVVCAIKTNRNISLMKGEWISLSTFSNQITLNQFENYFIDDTKYKINRYKVKLNGVPQVNMLVSLQFNEEKKRWFKPFHLISTSLNDTIITIIREYNLRWFIETFHRDIKQNLGFGKAHLRKREGIVRHAIFVVIAYIILKLFMAQRGFSMTIGECCSYIQNKEMDGFIREIIEIEDKEIRIKTFEEVFIRKTAKV